MFSVIGLSLDVVGAVALALGLFGHVRPSLWNGDVRSPEDAAHDAGFALVGAPLLTAGFVFQALFYLDVVWNTPVWARLVAALATVAFAALLGWRVYGLIFKSVLRRERNYRASALTDKGEWHPPDVRFGRLRFWR